MPAAGSRPITGPPLPQHLTRTSAMGQALWPGPQRCRLGHLTCPHWNNDLFYLMAIRPSPKLAAGRSLARSASREALARSAPPYVWSVLCIVYAGVKMVLTWLKFSPPAARLCCVLRTTGARFARGATRHKTCPRQRLQCGHCCTERVTGDRSALSEFCFGESPP